MRMDKKVSSCNFLIPVVNDASTAYRPLYMRLKRNFRTIPKSLYSRLTKTKTHPPFTEQGSLNLQPGEWVEVRSIDEINLTLDERQKYKGLYFMPEMEQFCGKKFRVFKKAQTIKLESNGEVRKLKSPSVFLEGVYCTGEGRNEGCDRACFHFWREAWLKRVPDNMS